MFRSSYAIKAAEYAVLAAAAQTDDERELYLSLEKSFRKFADADRRISQARDRHPAVFARRPYRTEKAPEGV